jgi:hypothetical protein
MNAGGYWVFDENGGFAILRRSALLALCLLSGAAWPAVADSLDLTRATVVFRGGQLPAAEKIAPVILTEEIAKRTGDSWRVVDQWPAKAEAIIALSTRSAPPAWKEQIPAGFSAALDRPEGFSIRVARAAAGKPATVFITGTDPRGVLFGVGKLLRVLEWGNGPITLAADFKADLSPDRPLRGHQIGYRPTANSWDAWTVEQYDQYFRDMVVFGANAVENIPFHEEFENQVSPMKYSRPFMNVKFSELCEKYDLDHWVWVPIQVALPNPKEGTAFLKHQEDFYKACKRLDAVFIPGGDPGDNRARNLLPYAEQMADVLRKYHPKATIWISLQKFRDPDVDDFYAWLEAKKPQWFGGIVMGPSSPPLEETRRRLLKQYKLRWYPDITHIVRCQYPVPWLDPVLGLTIGREPVNPRPVDYSAIYRNGYRSTDGFLTYSDGVHDDFNKNLWTQLGWDPARPAREVAVEYARYFFRPDVAEAGADALCALETNLRGGLAANGSVDGTLLQWQQLEHKLAGSPHNWRLDMHVYRAYYDGYTRHRKIYEDELEKLALEKLGEAEKIGVPAALDQARRILNCATTQPRKKEWYDRVVALAESLYQQIGLQTSVEKYCGSSYERGCSMDFVNYPLNDRWWLEDRFDEIAKTTDKSAQLKQIEVVRNWENPGEGGYYEVLGDVSLSPHIPRLLYAGDVMQRRRDPSRSFLFPVPEQRWIGSPARNGLRFAWHNSLFVGSWGITYTALDPHANYTVKLCASRLSRLMIDGKPAKPIRQEQVAEQMTQQEFQVPQDAVQDGRIVLSWGRPDPTGQNRRQGFSRLSEIWVIRH